MRYEPVENCDKTPLGLAGWVMQVLKTNFDKVELHQQWNPQLCEDYPRIFVKRLDWNVNRGFTTAGNYTKLNSSLDYEMWMPIVANFQVLCVGKEYGETEKLANDVWNFLTIFSDPIRRHSNLSGFTVTSITPVELAKEEKSLRVASITLSLNFEIVWKLTLEKGTIREAIITT